MPPRTNSTKEGTRCTAFPYCRAGVQRLLEVIYAIIFTGGFLAGPRTLRPERLQWLTTSAANRLASIRTILWSLTVGSIARTAPNRSIYRVDTVRSGALEELPLTPKDAASRSMFRTSCTTFAIRTCAFQKSSQFWVPFLFFRILHRAQSWKGHSLLSFATWESGAALS